MNKLRRLLVCVLLAALSLTLFAGCSKASKKSWLYSCFDASYGWETVMMDAFDKIAPFLEDGSEIKIYPDSGRDYGYVDNGEVIWQ